LGRLAGYDINHNGQLDPKRGGSMWWAGTKPDPDTGDPIPGDGRLPTIC